MRPTPHCSCSRWSMNSATVCDIQHLLPPARAGAGDGLGRQATGEYAGSEEGPLERLLAVQAAAAEARRLARGVKAGNGIAVGPQDAAAEVGLDAAQALARHDLHPDRQQRHGLVVDDLLEP